MIPVGYGTALLLVARSEEASVARILGLSGERDLLLYLACIDCMYWSRVSLVQSLYYSRSTTGHVWPLKRNDDAGEYVSRSIL